MNTVREAHVYIELGDEAPTFAGLLKSSNSARRNLASTSFQYDSGYRAHPHAYPISPELPLVSTRTFTPENRTIFGGFADASPDTWGKKLIEAAHELKLGNKSRLPRNLTDLDYLLDVSDFARIGAMRFKEPRGDKWWSSGTEAAGIHDLERLIAVARRYEEQIASDEDLAHLSEIAVGPGGARPKVNVIMNSGSLAIAKLPHSRDGNTDVESWEALALTLAENIGIRTPRFEHRRAGIEKSVLVVQRFDRVGEHARLGYMSAATAMQLGPLREGRATYQDFADTISELSSKPADDLHEMFTRVALTVLINNVDDHWRNHGFLHDRSGWRLSPVFDVNPSTARSLSSRAINAEDDPRNRDIRNLASVAGNFNLTSEQAVATIRRVAVHVEAWPTIATSLGIPVEQQLTVSRAFDPNQLSVAREFSPSAPPAVVLLAPAVKSGPTGAVWIPPHLRGGAQVAGHWRAARHSS